MVDVVLVNPEIPPNTGNIGRLTLGCGAGLTIVGEPSFDLDADTAMERAGLDYWDKVDLTRYRNWEDFRDDTQGPRYLVTKFAETPYHEVEFETDGWLIFGGENHGVPEKVHNDPTVERICIPMRDTIRAFNVCNAVAVTLFEALRQTKPDWFERTDYSGEFP